MRARQKRHQLFLSETLSARLEALAAKPGASKSAILADALEAWLTNRAFGELETAFGQTLRQIGTRIGRIERNGHVLLETLALFVRYELAIHAPLPENDAAGRAAARERFNAFVNQVGRQIASGRTTITSPSVAEDGR